MRELTPDEVAGGLRGINEEDLSATQIQALVRQMDASKQRWARLKVTHNKLYIRKLETENEKLYYNYPSLFQMHAEDRLDSTFFEMMTLKRKIEKGEITPEQASEYIGKKLHTRFVEPAPAANAPPPLSYESFYANGGSS